MLRLAPRSPVIDDEVSGHRARELDAEVLLDHAKRNVDRPDIPAEVHTDPSAMKRRSMSTLTLGKRSWRARAKNQCVVAAASSTSAAPRVQNLPIPDEPVPFAEKNAERRLSWPAPEPSEGQRSRRTMLDAARDSLKCCRSGL